MQDAAGEMSELAWTNNSQGGVAAVAGPTDVKSSNLDITHISNLVLDYCTAYTEIHISTWINRSH